MNILEFKILKQKNEKITFVTCYDYTSAQIVSKTDIHCILVGDSAAMMMHGHATTVPATVDMICIHTQAVVRGAPKKFVVADMPFLSYRKDLPSSMSAAQQLMQAGAHAIKLEGCEGNESLIQHLVASGVPVMGHLGLTPQSVHQLGGFKMQGKDSVGQQLLIEQAKKLEDQGCFSVVLECIPSVLAKTISDSLSIPTIGIGAGPHTDGQILVFHDLLGLGPWNPTFAKRYVEGARLFQDALNCYHQEVQHQLFPLQSNASIIQMVESA